MKTQHLIIGFGKAGKTLAAELGKAGQKTVLVEKSEKMYGGTCINIACIPTKHLRELALEGKSLRAAVKEKNTLVEGLREKNFDKVNKTKNVEVINGTATFLDENTVEVTTSDKKKTKITAENIYINTGTVPNMPPIEGAEISGIYDSTSIMELSVLPKKLVIVGGGFIGLEFAGIFSAFGSKVTVIDHAKEFLPNEDKDVSALMKKILEKQGVSFLQNTSVESFRKNGKKVTVHISGKNKKTVSADAVLMATGRKPNLQSLKTENAGIKLTEKKFIKVNSKLQTNKKHIWALGDINGGPQFTYISLDDYRIVKNQILGGDYTSTKKRQAFATTTFTNPPLSHIGLRENELENPANYTVNKIAADTIPKAKILGQTEGFLKAIVDKKTKKIVGCTLFCAESHEMINTVKTVMDAGLPYTTLQNQIFTHPSMSEALNTLFTLD